MLQTHTIFPGAVSNIPSAFSPARLLTQDDSVFLVYASGNKIVFISQELTPIEKISSLDLGRVCYNMDKVEFAVVTCVCIQDCLWKHK